MANSFEYKLYCTSDEDEEITVAAVQQPPPQTPKTSRKGVKRVTDDVEDHGPSKRLCLQTLVSKNEEGESEMVTKLVTFCLCLSNLRKDN
jgi:hypothetical protein